MAYLAPPDFFNSLDVIEEHFFLRLVLEHFKKILLLAEKGYLGKDFKVTLGIRGDDHE